MIVLTEQEAAREELIRGWVEFLGRWEWKWFGTFLFKDSVHPERAAKSFGFWLSQVNRKQHGSRWRLKGGGLPWVRASEWTKRGVLHYHALLGFTPELLEDGRRFWWQERWLSWAGGYCRLLAIESEQAVLSYVTKYVAKGGLIDVGGPLRTGGGALAAPLLGYRSNSDD